MPEIVTRVSRTLKGQEVNHIERIYLDIAVTPEVNYRDKPEINFPSRAYGNSRRKDDNTT